MIQQQSRLRRHLWLAGIAIAAALSATVSHARGSIESVTGFLQGGAEVLRIEFSEPQTELPTGFAVQTPARIALDFPGVTNASGRSLVEINQGNVKSAHIVEAGERWVIDYKTSFHGGGQLQEPAAQPVATSRVVNNGKKDVPSILLQPVFVDVGFVEEVDVFLRSVVTVENLDMIFLDQAGFLFDSAILIGYFVFEELIPLLVGERITVEQLKLGAKVVDQIRFAVDRYIVVCLFLQ